MNKALFFKIILYFSLIGMFIFSLLFVLYVYNISKINESSKSIADSFSLSYLYSNNPSYSISTNTLDNSTSASFNNFVIGIIKIDKLKLDYPILSEESEELLKIAPCRFAGPLPNEIGNLCIAGHNYIDNTFFARISSLTFGDEIKIYGIDGNLVKYSVFNKTEVESSDLSCTDQNTFGKRIVTLMTCNSIKKTRIIIQAVEV